MDTQIRTAFSSNSVSEPDVAWVTLPGRNAVRVGLSEQGHRHPDDELIAAAQAHWAQRDREDVAGAALATKYPDRQVFSGYLPSRDSEITWDGEAGWYVYVLALRRRRGVYPVEEAIQV